MNNLDNVFVEFVLGIALLTQEQNQWSHTYPPGLIHAMNAIALQKKGAFPKTFSAFLDWCGKPLSGWFPHKVNDFNTAYALLDNGQLTEPASDYLYGLPNELLAKYEDTGFLPESVLDNLAMVRFIQLMHNLENMDEAQHRYALIRSFLIEYSWISRSELLTLKRQGIPQNLIDQVKTDFYIQEDSTDTFYVCDRCGILRLIDGQLIGIKPTYCDDHASGSPHIRTVEVFNYSRLKTGIHLRTFIPGQAERKIFEAAETLQDSFPDHLTQVVRYPGVDAYDMRLVFRDEVWAVDVKDIADPKMLGTKIHRMPSHSGLEHDKAFYVVPDRRLQLVPDYLNQVRRRKSIKPPLFLVSQEDFCARMQAKCDDLVRASR